MPTKYLGVRRQRGTGVVVCDDEMAEPLPPRLDLARHSPTGFEWGYAGSGPAQLALAILAHHLRNDDRALRLYQRFKVEVVQNLPRQGWALADTDIMAWVETQR